MSRVEGERSRVRSQGSRVRTRESKVASRGSHVEGHRSKVRKSSRESKVKGQNLSVCMFLIVLKNEVFLSVLVG